MNLPKNCSVYKKHLIYKLVNTGEFEICTAENEHLTFKGSEKEAKKFVDSLMLYPLTDEHKRQLDGLINETILPALVEDFDHNADREDSPVIASDERVDEFANWHDEAIDYLIGKLKTKISTHKSVVGRIPTKLIGFLNGHEFTKEEKMDLQYICDKIQNFAKLTKTHLSDREIEIFGKQYQLL